MIGKSIRSTTAGARRGPLLSPLELGLTKEDELIAATDELLLHLALRRAANKSSRRTVTKARVLCQTISEL